MHTHTYIAAWFQRLQISSNQKLWRGVLHKINVFFLLTFIFCLFITCLLVQTLVTNVTIVKRWRNLPFQNKSFRTHQFQFNIYITIPHHWPSLSSSYLQFDLLTFDLHHKYANCYLHYGHMPKDPLKLLTLRYYVHKDVTIWPLMKTRDDFNSLLKGVLTMPGAWHISNTSDQRTYSRNSYHLTLRDHKHNLWPSPQPSLKEKGSF